MTKADRDSAGAGQDLTFGSQVRPELLHALQGLQGSCCLSHWHQAHYHLGQELAVALTPASERQAFLVWFLPASNGTRVSDHD